MFVYSISNSFSSRFLCTVWIYFFFRIVCRLASVEYRHYFMFFKWLLISEQKICSFLFIPYPVISVLFYITHSQSRAKRLTSKQYNSSIWFYYSLQLLPHLIERYDRVPFTCSSSIWGISNNTIYRLIRNTFHSFQTILVEYLIYHKLIVKDFTLFCILFT